MYLCVVIIECATQSTDTGVLPTLKNYIFGNEHISKCIVFYNCIKHLFIFCVINKGEVINQDIKHVSYTSNKISDF